MIGRKKKIVAVDIKRYDNMLIDEKIKLFNDFEALISYETRKIPQKEIITCLEGKAERIAELYYISEGLRVYHSRVRNGYRCIGTEFYWKQYADGLDQCDIDLIKNLKEILNKEEIELLAHNIRSKNGTPDLLLIKDNVIRFVEVKSDYEEIKPSTIKFYVQFSNIWPISILRIRKEVIKE